LRLWRFALNSFTQKKKTTQETDVTLDGYYRSPTIAGETVVFVGEDDLWAVSAKGGVAHRLTANLGLTSTPAFSPDGQWLAFTGREDGEAEVYVMPATGGPATRLTYLGATTVVLGWDAAGDKIVFASNTGQPFRQLTPLFAVSRSGGPPELLPYGPARSVSFGPGGGVVIGRRAWSLANWKRYRGGTAGDIWIDVTGKGKFKSLLKLHSNLVRPLWLGERIYFLSDHEGVGNLYSCTPNGADITRHTHHEDFYVRQSATDGRRIVYRAGADLYLFDPATAQSRKIGIEFHSSQVQRNRKFVKPAAYLTSSAIHPGGHSVALTVRGKAFSMSNWEGAVLQYSEPDGVRYRLPEWLYQAKHLLLVSDAGGEEAFEIHPDPSQLPNDQAIERLDGLDIGRPLATKMSPREDLVAFSNHRYELVLLDVPRKSVTVLDKSHFGRIRGIDWSPDGKWIAYGFCSSAHTCAIKLYHVDSGQTHYVTPPNTLFDFGPSFDPGGKYLYFISYRDFNPVHDSVYFDLNFPRGSRPYLVTLKKDVPDPFISMPNGHTSPAPNGNGKPDAPSTGETDEADKSEDKPAAGNIEPPVTEIELEGIQQRVLAFPVSEGKYRQVGGIKGKVLFTSFPIEGSLHQSWDRTDDEAGKGVLELYDLTERKKEFVVSGVNSFELSRNRAFFMVRSGKNLRVLKAGEKPDSTATGFVKKSGWINLNRVRVAVNPPDEWRQMFREAWRLQRDHFWSEDMSSVDWQAVYQRYYPLVDRVTTRSEFSDLLLEMQGELGTSHAYELGGDYRAEPRYVQGFLGADFEYDAASGGYRITAMVQGDSWSQEQESPLRRLGINLGVGDILLAIDGRRLGPNLTPAQALVNRASAEIQLTVLSPAASAPDGSESPEPRPVLVNTLANEMPARYREWVEANRRRVHEATEGRVGYLHIPDMGPRGYSEFHRYYLAESEREGLIIDLRFNGGGNVSQLLLEKLSRRRIGYDQPRYGQAMPYPSHSVLGPLVAITNEYAGSDGDIFSHVFKLLKLGPLIGKRTWGGVVGIWPRHSLVDGTTTTQPEFSFWFEDVGWAVENYGTDPDIEVDIKPQDYAAGKDPQLDRALKEIGNLLADNPPKIPDFGAKPSLMLPTLPKIRKRKK
jgi:tricorn protease